MAALLSLKNTPKIHIFRTGAINCFFKVMLIVCQIFCAAPILNKKKQVLIKIHLVWCMALILLVAGASCSLEEVFAVKMFTIKKALYLGEFFSDVGLMFLTVVTCYIYKNCYNTFPDRIQELHKRVQIYQLKKLHQQTDDKMHKKIVIVAVVGMLFFTSTLLTDFFYTPHFVSFLKSSLVYILPNVTISLWFGQYWILQILIVSRYREVNSILRELSDSRVEQTSSCSMLAEVVKQQQNGKLRWDAAVVLDDLRNVFAHLDALVSDLNDVFGLTITANFFGSFLTLSLQFFILYKMPDQDDTDWAQVLYSVSWISLHTLKFLVVLQTNSCILNEKTETGTILNNINTFETKIEDAINRFLMQLVVRNGVQMACGIVELDMELIGGVISALSIYVIFLVQIDLGEITTIRVVNNNTSSDFIINHH